MTDIPVHIHQCPFCELRFRAVNEVRDHVIHDHPEHSPEFMAMSPHELPRPAPLLPAVTARIGRLRRVHAVGAVHVGR